MEGVLLQDWLTLTGQSGSIATTQSESGYLDLGESEDLTFFLDVSSVAGAVSVTYQTAPTRSDGGFLPVLAPISIGAPGLRVDRAPFALALTPPSRFVRWRMSSTLAGGAWSVTFRIWLATYAY